VEQFTFDVQHRAGTRHQNADSLSRRPCEREGLLTKCRPRPMIETVSNSPEISDVESASVTGRGDDSPSCHVAAVSGRARDELWNNESLGEEQRGDADLLPLISALSRSAERPPWSEIQACAEGTKILWTQWPQLTLVEGVLHRKFMNEEGGTEFLQLVVPRVRRQEFLRLVHEGMTEGHLGIGKTTDQVQRRAFWPGWRRDTRLYCLRCKPCCRYHRGDAPK
jgi:hypothetical protein